MQNNKTETAPTKPSRRIFFNLGTFQFLTFLRRGVFYTFMIPYLNVLMGTVTYTAMFGTFTMIASSLGQNLLWGKICDRYRTRTKLIISGEAIAAFTYIIVFFIHKSLLDSGNMFSSGLAIISGLSILEFFWSMSDVGWAALLTDVTTPEIRGKTVGTMNFIASLGRMVGIQYAGFLYDNGQGFQNGTIFYVVTILLLTGAVLMAFTSRQVKTRKNTQEQSCADKKQTQEQRHTAFEGENQKTYRWFLVSLIVIVLGASSISQVFILFTQLKEGLNASGPEMGFILTAWTIGGMIASLTAGGLADRIGRSKVLLLGLGLGTITPLLYSSAPNVLSLALVYSLNGMSFWTIQTIGFVFAGDLIPEQSRARSLSRYNMVMALSWGPAGLLIGGPLADIQTKSLGIPVHTAYVNTFYASTIILALGTLLFVLKVARPKKTEALKHKNP